MEEEKKEPETEETPEENKKQGKKEAKLNKRIEELEAESSHWKNAYYRAYADLENLRKSLEEDHRNALKYRAEGFLEELIPALDAFHSALSAPAPSKDAENYKIGFGYIYKQIVSALEAEGFKQIEPQVGDPFDARYMQAVDTVEDEKEGLVHAVHAKGYQLKDRMIRPVMVTATVKKTEKKEEKEEAHKA